MERTGEVTVVYGLQRGDEGKGRFTDSEAPDHDIVARFGGGQNAGHTVLIGDTELALSLLPSGIMHESVANVVGNGCVIDPMKAVREFRDVRAAGAEITPDRLLISSAAHLVLPHHIEADKIREASDARQGSTKNGISQVYAAKHLRVGRRVEDINNQINELGQAARAGLEAQQEMRAQLDMDPLDIDEVVDGYVDAAQILGPYVTDTSLYLHRRMAAGANVLAEGAQAFLLDIDHGMYPFTTSSATSAAGVSQGLGIPSRSITRIIGVAKLTQSHVGGGPFVTEIHDEDVLGPLRGSRHDVDGEFGTVTGRVRRMGYLDLPGIRRAQIINGDTEMAVTKLDRVPDYGSEIPVCVAYQRKGSRITIAPDASYKLDQSTPIFETLPSWDEDISSIRDFDSLPANARSYIEFIEQQTGLPITMIGVGPEREQVIRRG